MTKSENQSTTCATRISDSGTKCNIENIPKEEIQTNATEAIETTIESLSSTNPFTKKESCTQDLQSDNNDDLKYPQIERKNPCMYIKITDNQREKQKYCIERKDSNSSSDYEKMDIIDYKVSTFDGTSKIDPAMPNKTILEPLMYIYKIEKNIPVASKIAGKSRSVNDLAIRETTYEDPLEYLKQDAESTTSDEDDNASSRHKKKKRRFTRNVFHYVPRHLVKQPKKKKKSKKKYALSNSLSSLQMTSFSKTQGTCTGIRNLSREELKGVIISSPTNFVHVASATNPSLVRDTIVGSGLEQVVITHQQICASLPLLVGKDERRKSENENAERPKVTAGMSPDVISKQSKENQSAVESVAGTSNRISLLSSIMVKEFMQMLSCTSTI